VTVTYLHIHSRSLLEELREFVLKFSVRTADLRVKTSDFPNIQQGCYLFTDKLGGTQIGWRIMAPYNNAIFLSGRRDQPLFPIKHTAIHVDGSEDIPTYIHTYIHSISFEELYAEGNQVQN
jgi:hypothetical protein